MKKTAAFILAMLLTAALALPAFAASAAPDLENGLVAHYTFDEYDPVSQTYADSSKVNPGPVEKMMGTAYTSPGPVGNAAYFDSNTVYMSDYQDFPPNKKSAPEYEMTNMPKMNYYPHIGKRQQFPAHFPDKVR